MRLFQKWSPSLRDARRYTSRYWSVHKAGFLTALQQYLLSSTRFLVSKSQAASRLWSSSSQSSRMTYKWWRVNSHSADWIQLWLTFAFPSSLPQSSTRRSIPSSKSKSNTLRSLAIRYKHSTQNCNLKSVQDLNTCSSTSKDPNRSQPTRPKSKRTSWLQVTGKRSRRTTRMWSRESWRRRTKTRKGNSRKMLL